MFDKVLIFGYCIGVSVREGFDALHVSPASCAALLVRFYSQLGFLFVSPLESA